MELTIEKQQFLRGLTRTHGVADRKSSMHILSNVLLVAKAGELAVTATDLEVELVAQANVDVQAGGEITVSGRKLLEGLVQGKNGIRTRVTYQLDIV